MTTGSQTTQQNISEQALRMLAQQLGERLMAKDMKLAVAESCTGGWLAKIITDIAGSSAWFTGSIVCYSNESKHRLLGVRQSTLNTSGAVSRETVLELVDGLFINTDADITASISGIAGPGGGSVDKPVGLVWLAWGIRGEPVFAGSFHFEGDREAVRRQSVLQALNRLLELVD